ncbi:MAG: sporulation protein YqfC [Paenibacillaceae bacterium]
MRRLRKKLNEWTSQVIDLPPDVTLDLPRMTMIGNQRIMIENHRGLVHFSSEHLKLAIHNGVLELLGSELMIRTISTEEISIEGQIDAFKYLMNGNR